MTEHELQAEVLAIARRLGLWTRHVPDSRRILLLEQGRGFPDLEVWGTRELMVVELKTEGAQLSADQRKWRYRIEQAGTGFRVFRPAQLRTGVIETELRRLAG